MPTHTYVDASPTSSPKDTESLRRESPTTSPVLTAVNDSRTRDPAHRIKVIAQLSAVLIVARPSKAVNSTGTVATPTDGNPPSLPSGTSSPRSRHVSTEFPAAVFPSSTKTLPTTAGWPALTAAKPGPRPSCAICAVESLGCSTTESALDAWTVRHDLVLSLLS